MTEHNVEGLLEAKAQILDEKKRLQKKYEELQVELEQAQLERDSVRSELERITIHQPRQRLIEEVAAEGRSDMLWRELNHHYKLERLEDGSDVLQNAEGETVAEFTVDGINKLLKENLLNGIGALLKGSGATGGGATGGGSGIPTTRQVKETPKVSFGLR